MKANKLFTFVLSVFACFFMVSVTKGETAKFVFKEEPVRYVKPLVIQSPAFAPAGVQHSLPHLAMMHEKIEIASLCSSLSPNVAQSRRNVMAGLIGMEVNTDMASPAGWYLIPTNGWQWHHMISSTTLPLFRGITNGLEIALQGERGNRVVVSVVGKGTVSTYQCRISSSLTNIQDITFWVGKDTVSGQTLMFNANFVGIHFGPNGILESMYNPAIGVWNQIGDDTVYSNGEDPDVVSYTVWVRYGASVSVTANSEIGMNMVKNQFIRGNQIFTSQLIKNGEVVNEKMIMAEQPELIINNERTIEDLPSVNLILASGQDDVIYQIQKTTDLESEWTDHLLWIWKKGGLKLGAGVIVTSENQFFRVRAVLP